MCQKGRKYQPHEQTRLVYLCNSSIMWWQDQIATSNSILVFLVEVAFLVNM